MDIGVSMVISSNSMDVAVLAEKAEALGFDSFWLPEHPVIPVKTNSKYGGTPDGSIPTFMMDMADPFITLARASAVTKKIMLGTSICLVPEHNPIDQAKQIATLDRISGGRFIFGIGAGWLKEETEIMGGNFEHRWGQTRESILAMKELWTKDESEFHGKYFDFPPVRSFPKPVQSPHPPVWVAAASPTSLERVARHNWNLLVGQGEPFGQVAAQVEQYRTAVGEAGFEYHPGKVVVARPMYTAAVDIPVEQADAGLSLTAINNILVGSYPGDEISPRRAFVSRIAEDNHQPAVGRVAGDVAASHVPQWNRSSSPH